MKVEVLASVMNASLPETVQHMNLQSDAVIINQCDRLGQDISGERKNPFLQFSRSWHRQKPQ